MHLRKYHTKRGTHNPDQNKFLNYFTEIFYLKKLITEPTYFKSQNPSMIDLVVLLKTAVLETGVSDHNKMIFSILKHTFAEGTPKLFAIEIRKTLIKKAFNSYLEAKMSECPNSLKKFLQIFEITIICFTIICSFEKENYSL